MPCLVVHGFCRRTMRRTPTRDMRSRRAGPPRRTPTRRARSQWPTSRRGSGRSGADRLCGAPCRSMPGVTAEAFNGRSGIVVRGGAAARRGGVVSSAGERDRHREVGNHHRERRKREQRGDRRSPHEVTRGRRGPPHRPAGRHGGAEHDGALQAQLIHVSNDNGAMRPPCVPARSTHPSDAARRRRACGRSRR